ncbi:MAG TPA: hypothetical protein VFQ79_23860 [Bryobacteraceae bacterium]|nr:hypothetical protein [Bryobacteraceae bacterium]
MTKLQGLGLFVLMTLLFLVANRGAYQGYFHGDDLDNVSWTPGLENSEYASALVSPKLSPWNFRPVGHFYFAALGRTAGLDYRWYVAVLHGLHLLNVWLIWLLLRRLNLGLVAASAGALVFAFHMGVFEALWKPMYVFDVLCGTFCLLCLLLYVRGNLILSVLSFWLAYKSKEVAIMLPVVLAAWEFWLAEKRWKRLLPFFSVSLLFGLQAIFRNSAKNDDYTFHFTLDAWRITVPFYTSKIFLLPFSGLFTLVFAAVFRDRRVWLGVAALWILLLPLLFLPGRIFQAYLYVPLIGLAIAMAAISARQKTAVVAVFFLLFWIPWNYSQMRIERRKMLTQSDENRAYITQMAQLLRKKPAPKVVVYDTAPEGLQLWGVAASVHIPINDLSTKIYRLEDKEAAEALRNPGVMVVSWDHGARKLWAASRTGNERRTAYIEMKPDTPIWLLTEGWFPREHFYRWTRPRARAGLYRPVDAREFQLIANVPDDQIRATGPFEVSITADGNLIGRHTFKESGLQTVNWRVAAAQPGDVEIELAIDPGFDPSGGNPASLGIAVAGIGFVPPGPSGRVPE